MEVAVVIPCLNEQETIAATARSLGFGEGIDPPAGAQLVLVDNGSSDGTWDVMGRVAAEAPSGAVLRIVEGERGFVPPRDRGVRHAALLAAERGCQADQLLILQADADTEYLPYYIERMRAAASADTLVEASIGRAKPDDPRLANYRALELEVDGRTRSLEVADSDEVLIDDKACGYRLSDYQRWGGLRREYLPDGSEIHAETSRMYLRALATAGAKRERVERAGALTSARRIYENPTLNFATAGFPREASWLHAFADAARASGGPRVQMDETRSTVSPMAQRLRVGHNIVLFSLLPRIVAHLFGRRLNGGERLQGVIEALPRFEIEDLRQRPGWMISVLLSMLDDPRSPLHTLIDSIVVEEPRAFDLS